MTSVEEDETKWRVCQCQFQGAIEASGVSVGLVVKSSVKRSGKKTAFHINLESPGERKRVRPPDPTRHRGLR